MRTLPEPPRSERTGWTNPGWAALYWVTAALGIVGGTASWLWLSLASEEATRGATPDRSAPNPGTTSLGVPGLLAIHALGLLLLLMAARVARHDRRSAVWFAIGALVVGSLAGLAVSLALTGGHVVADWSGTAQP